MKMKLREKKQDLKVLTEQTEISASTFVFKELSFG